MNQKIADELRRIAGADNITTDEPMDRHTSFRIGGPADYFAAPQTREQITELLSFCEREGVPYFLMGNGSNLLVGDEGYRGLIIQLWRNFSRIDLDGNVITAQAGAMLSAVARTAALEGLAGMEFASGIPGTIGGAAVMNAGAYGGEMRQIIRSVTMITADHSFTEKSNEEMEFGYRTSYAQKNNCIILGAVIELERGDKDQIMEKIEDLRMQRVSKQPLDLPSAGSTFKRPSGYFAGKLIMDAGLRGFTVGGAQVSEKHCGFVVNRGGATAADVCALMREVRRRVKEMTGVELEPEVKMIGCSL
ncbi:MAG: UDP-N-acetylmuramate dehydrogenase [Lachnospiraceae bacterium]|nr:UDP-N-acetylmuramate dehydrogenase [Lachnospiraceae bacterium]